MLTYPSISKQVTNIPVYSFDKVDDLYLDEILSPRTFRISVNSKICEECGKSYLPKKATQRFCIRACFVEHQRRVWSSKQISTECSYCGIKVYRTESQVKFKKIFCSIEHKRLGSRKGWEERTCRACGEKFSVKLHDKMTHCSPLHGMWTRTEHSLRILPMRLAWEQDQASFVMSVKSFCSVTATDCWMPTWTESPYPQFSLPGINATQLHRIMLIIHDRPPQDTLEQAHHTCANARCVNPNHLQWLSPHDNLAEMKERGRYILRIKRLEIALYELSPDHPLLKGFNLSEIQ